MGVKERRINKLIDLFNEKETLTLEEIKQELDIKNRSVRTYIGYLREYGIEVQAMDFKYKVIHKEKIKGSILNKQEHRMMKAMLTVSENNGMFNKKDLEESLSKSLYDEDGLSRKTIERTIKSCEEKGYIYSDENNKYRISMDTEYFYFTDYEDIYKFAELCDVYSESMPFYKEVNKLKNKIMDQLDYEETSYNVCCIGRKYGEGTISRDIVKQFEALDYRRKAVTIVYDTRKGEATENVQVVTLLYNWEKDSGYVIGFMRNMLSFINIKTIKAILPSQEDNRYFNHKKTLDKLDLMFGASLDGFYEVKVEFDNIFNIKEKVQRLHLHRKKSKLLEFPDKLIYSDSIYGIYDFAKYLRSFGSACRVIEPQELKDIMRKTYEHILLNYGEA